MGRGDSEVTKVRMLSATYIKSFCLRQWLYLYCVSGYQGKSFDPASSIRFAARVSFRHDE